MIGLIFKIWLAAVLCKSAARMGAGLPSISKRRFWLYALAGVPVEMILMNASSLRYDRYGRVDQSVMLVGAITLIAVFVLLPALIAWFIGRSRRTASSSPQQMFYLHDNGQESGPFPLSQLLQMRKVGRIGDAAYVCRDGDPKWTSLAEMNTSTGMMKQGDESWFKSRLAKLRESFQPSELMNYRIFIPSIVAALILGALLHSWLGERYRFQSMGNGHMMKTDRWTGEAWTTYTSNGKWVPVDESKRAVSNFLKGF